MTPILVILGLLATLALIIAKHLLDEARQWHRCPSCKRLHNTENPFLSEHDMLVRPASIEEMECCFCEGARVAKEREREIRRRERRF